MKARMYTLGVLLLSLFVFITSSSFGILYLFMSNATSCSKHVAPNVFISSGSLFNMHMLLNAAYNMFNRSVVIVPTTLPSSLYTFTSGPTGGAMHEWMSSLSYTALLVQCLDQG